MLTLLFFILFKISVSVSTLCQIHSKTRDRVLEMLPEILHTNGKTNSS